MKEPLGKPVGKPQEKSGEITSEIIKLIDKLAKDPKSKLFVPLAEEYLKVGMLDEAVMVLTDGLKHHPGFLTARVALGKVYLQRAQPAEARAEFEAVIAANPENLLAQRKLAQLYLDAGEPQRARDCAGMVLSENAKDADMRRVVELAEQRLEASAAAVQPIDVTVGESEMPLLDSGRADAVEVGPAEASASAELESIEPMSAESAPAEPSAAAVAPEPVDLAPPIADPSPIEAPPQPSAAPRVELSSAATESLDEILAELGLPKAAAAAPPPVPAEAGAVEILSESLADLYVQQGLMDKGIEIYRKILEREPDRPGLNDKLTRVESLARIPPGAEVGEASAPPAPKAEVEGTSAAPAASAPLVPKAEVGGASAAPAASAPPVPPGAEPIELAAELGGPMGAEPEGDAVAAAGALPTLITELGMPEAAPMEAEPAAAPDAPAPAWAPEPAAENVPIALEVSDVPEQGPAEAVGEAAGKSLRRRKIERLQAWLASIRRGLGG